MKLLGTVLVLLTVGAVAVLTSKVLRVDVGLEPPWWV